jgi:hypothetical protein
LKKKKTSHLDYSGHIEGDVMHNHEQKKKVKNSEKPRFYGQTKLFFENPALQLWVVIATWLHVEAPQKRQEK